MTMPSGGDFYKHHPQTCEPEDFWGQVMRTVDGKAVDQAQIDMIVATVAQELELSADDLLLDLCCGNGALTTYFFSRCRGGLGVDFSDYLIQVARQHFSTRPGHRFELGDVMEYARNAAAPESFTKALCYGSYQYLEPAAATELLALLRQRFTGLARLLIGNLPDKGRLEEFYRTRAYTPGIEDRADTPIGIWRTPEEFAELAARAGWQCAIVRMPPEFYAAHYRYDAVLTPA
ncbi:MAG: class I SAM-dependent methyltransferase [Rhodocyclales bacterium]|nr:class I SAM-dependent methyltransferase [Rhodocyclales bacterium]